MQEKKVRGQRVQYDGERPMTWVREEEPLFRDMADQYKRETKNRAAPHFSKYAEGYGYFFPTEMYGHFITPRKLPS